MSFKPQRFMTNNKEMIPLYMFPVWRLMKSGDVVLTVLHWIATISQQYNRMFQFTGKFLRNYSIQFIVVCCRGRPTSKNHISMERILIFIQRGLTRFLNKIDFSLLYFLSRACVCVLRVWNVEEKRKQNSTVYVVLTHWMNVWQIYTWTADTTKLPC